MIISAVSSTSLFQGGESLKKRSLPRQWYPYCTLRRWFKVLLCDVHLIDMQVNRQHYSACPQVQYLCVYRKLLTTLSDDKSQTISSQDLEAARHFGRGRAHTMKTCCWICWYVFVLHLINMLVVFSQSSKSAWDTILQINLSPSHSGCRWWSRNIRRRRVAWRTGHNGSSRAWWPVQFTGRQVGINHQPHSFTSLWYIL